MGLVLLAHARVRTPPHRASQFAKRGFRIRGGIDVVANLSQDAHQVIQMGAVLIYNQDLETDWRIGQMRILANGVCT